MRIIDCHCHIYPDKIAEKATEAIGNFYGYKMHLTGHVDNLIQQGKKAGITDFLVHSVATTPHQVKSVNDYIYAQVKAHPEFIGFGSLHPDSENPEEDIDYLISLGLRGVKLHPDFIQRKVDDPAFMKIFGLLEGRLPVCVHTGDRRYDNTNPERVKHVLEAFPDLKFIGAHFAGHSVWDDAIKLLPGYRNLYVDCSSSLAFITAEKATELVYAFGPERVLFGSDFPMWTAESELNLLSKLKLTDEEFEMIYHKNAEKLLNI